MFYQLKFIIRNLFKNGLYSVVNIVSLAISLAACAFILLWVNDENSYDRFHHDAENIYGVVTHFNQTKSADLASGLFAVVAEQNFDAVESYCRISNHSVGFLQYGGVRSGAKTMLMSDSTFFSFFGFPIVKGQMQGLLQAPDDAVISESLAIELFGDEDPIDKVVVIENRLSVRVSAVMKNFPHNTSLPCVDIVCTYEIDKESYYYRMLNTWEGCEFKTYLRLKSGTDIAELATSITDKQTVLRDSRSFTFQPLVDMHLYTIDGESARIKTLRIFFTIALVTLLIACVNYVNLITARSVRRRGEIILKKILGAKNWRLFVHLITEAFVLFVIAVMIAVMLNMLFMPLFNQLSGKTLSLAWFDFKVWRIYALMLLLLIGLAGVYPVRILLAFKPAIDMQEQKKSNPALRNALVVFQFVISTILITVTIMMESQLKYMRNKDLGFNKEQVLICNMYNMSTHFSAVKSELLSHTAVRDVTNANQNIMSVLSSTYSSWEGKTSEDELLVHQIRVDTSFVNVMQISLSEGHNFNSLTLRQVIPNETAIKAMDIKDPIGKWIEISEWGEKGIIVGIAKDFNFTTLYDKISPVVLYYEPSGFRYSQLFVRIEKGEEKQAITALEKLWKQYNPSYTFEYHFLDEEFNNTYKSEIRTSLLFDIFSCIAILISCLGLFGLITFITESKTKEIGIRKVLGASVISIVQLLFKEFLILIGVAILISFPLAYYCLDKLLQDYAYRITIGWWIFALAGIIIIMLTLLTVGWQVIKAAIANPVNAIKSE